MLALAIAAQADLVVSGDEDLPSLTSFDGIAIMSPEMALQRVMDAA